MPYYQPIIYSRGLNVQENIHLYRKSSGTINHDILDLLLNVSNQPFWGTEFPVAPLHFKLSAMKKHHIL